MQEILETGEYFNRSLITNNRLCAGAVFYLQVSLTLFFGFFVRPLPHSSSAIELADMLPVTAVALLVIVGTVSSR